MHGMLSERYRGRPGLAFLTVMLFLLLVFLVPASGSRAAEPVSVRVALVQGVPVVQWDIEAGRYAVTDASTGQILAEAAAGEKWQVVKEGDSLAVYRNEQKLACGKGPLDIQPVEGDPPLFRLDDTLFRGSLKITGETVGLLAVNVLDVEHYLYGVVGAEIGYDAPEEALKAQAVAARSYVLSSLQANNPYDIGRGTTAQVYGGFSAESVPVREAVEATASQVIYYDGRLVRAFYHSNAGGYTENSENIWQEVLPYLRAVPSPADTAALEYAPQAANGWPANTYNWEVDLSRGDLEEKIAAWNAGQLAAGKADQVIDVGRVTGFTLSRQSRDGSSPTPSGRVTRLDIIGEKGTHSLYRENARLFLGIKSTLFDLETDAQVYLLAAGGRAEPALSAADLVAVGAGGAVAAINGGADIYWVQGDSKILQVPKDFRRIHITGRGYGHGVGMSQWGARGMAVAGHNYQEIITYYYNQGRDDGRLTIGPYRPR